MHRLPCFLCRGDIRCQNRILEVSPSIRLAFGRGSVGFASNAVTGDPFGCGNADLLNRLSISLGHIGLRAALFREPRNFFPPGSSSEIRTRWVVTPLPLLG